MSISLVAGLGNPGREYEATRHNLGFLVLDALARRQGLAWQKQRAYDAETVRWDRAPGQSFLLVKPLTYMNDSGRSLQSLGSFYRIPPKSMVVLYDDLNIDLGLVKISVTGSAGGHNGVASLLQHLGDGFIRYRLGVGPKQPPQMDLKDFVLGKFTPDQQTIIDQSLDHYLSGLQLLLEQGTERAMNTLNRREKMSQNKRTYRATFILDNRGKEDTIEQIIDGVKNDITAVQGEVSAVENLGKRDFVRVTDKKLTAATYVQVDFSAPPAGPSQLKERLRLNNNVHISFVQSR